MAAAATEAWLSAGVLRRRELLGVSGRGFGRSRKPGWARPRPGLGKAQGEGKGGKGAAASSAAGSGLAPPPQGPEDVRGGRGPLSSASPVTRPTRPSWERPLGLCLDRPRGKGRAPLGL